MSVRKLQKHIVMPSALIQHFRVPDLNNECVGRCENALLECILACEDDVECLSECIRLETECTNGESDSSLLY